jgi:hypothetical protein
MLFLLTLGSAPILDERVAAWPIGPAMSDRVKLAREIAPRIKPSFIGTNTVRPQTVEGIRKLARAIAARTEPRFIVVPREIRGAKVPFTEEQLAFMRGWLTAEEYRRKLIRK